MKTILLTLAGLLIMNQAQAESLICQKSPGENEASLVIHLDDISGRWVATSTYVDTYLVQRIGKFEPKLVEAGGWRVWTAPGLTLKLDTSVRSRGYTRAQAKVVSQYSGKVWTETLLCR